MAFGYYGTMRTVPGKRDEVVEILLGGVDELRAAGCSVYAVALPDDDPDLISVSEVWESADQHAASLQLPRTKAAVAAAMPMLTGEFTGTRSTVVGGLGVA